MAVDPEDKVTDLIDDDKTSKVTQDKAVTDVKQKNKYGHKRDKLDDAADALNNWFGLKQFITGSSTFKSLYDQLDEGNRKIIDDLEGKNGDEAYKKAQNNLENKLNAYRNALDNGGNSGWADVCDPMCKALIAYMRYQHAKGIPNTFLGRCEALSGLAIFSPITMTASAVADTFRATKKLYNSMKADVDLEHNLDMPGYGKNCNYGDKDDKKVDTKEKADDIDPDDEPAHGSQP